MFPGSGIGLLLFLFLNVKVCTATPCSYLLGQNTRKEEQIIFPQDKNSLMRESEAEVASFPRLENPELVAIHQYKPKRIPRPGSLSLTEGAIATPKVTPSQSVHPFDHHSVKPTINIDEEPAKKEHADINYTGSPSTDIFPMLSVLPDLEETHNSSEEIIDLTQKSSPQANPTFTTTAPLLSPSLEATFEDLNNRNTSSVQPSTSPKPIPLWTVVQPNGQNGTTVGASQNSGTSKEGGYKRSPSPTEKATNTKNESNSQILSIFGDTTGVPLIGTPSPSFTLSGFIDLTSLNLTPQPTFLTSPEPDAIGTPNIQGSSESNNKAVSSFIPGLSNNVLFGICAGAGVVIVSLIVGTALFVQQRQNDGSQLSYHRSDSGGVTEAENLTVSRGLRNRVANDQVLAHTEVPVTFKMHHAQRVTQTPAPLISDRKVEREPRLPIVQRLLSLSKANSQTVPPTPNAKASWFATPKASSTRNEGPSEDSSDTG